MVKITLASSGYNIGVTKPSPFKPNPMSALHNWMRWWAVPCSSRCIRSATNWILKAMPNNLKAPLVKPPASAIRRRLFMSIAGFALLICLSYTTITLVIAWAAEVNAFLAVTRLSQSGWIWKLFVAFFMLAIALLLAYFLARQIALLLQTSVNQMAQTVSTLLALARFENTHRCFDCARHGGSSGGLGREKRGIFIITL
jgi:hypothetical protein